LLQIPRQPRAPQCGAQLHLDLAMTAFSPKEKLMQNRFSTGDLINGAKTFIQKLTPHHLVLGTAVTLTLVSWIWPNSAFFTWILLLAAVGVYVWFVQKSFRTLQEMVPIDPDTKLFGHQEGLRRLAAESTRAVEAGRPLFVSVIELSLGTGSFDLDPDELQRIVVSAAGLVSQQIRAYDCAVRTGDTSFLVIVPEGTSNGGTQARLKKLAKEVRLPSSAGPVSLVVRPDNLGQNEKAATFHARVEGLVDSTNVQQSTP
jgi:hypothetical protein